MTREQIEKMVFGLDLDILLENLSKSEFGKRKWGENKPFKYQRTTITHSKNGFKVCIQTDGFSFKGEGVTFGAAFRQAALLAIKEV